MAFKDLFIKSDGVEQSNNVQQPSQNVTQKTFTQVSTQSQSVSGSASQTQTIVSQSSIGADDKIVNKLWDKIIASNRPGPDYLELKNNVDALDDLPISNEQKLISAFKVLKKSYPNFQKEDIIKAIDFYTKIVNDEKDNGLKELDGLIAENVSKVEEEIKSMQIRSEDLKREYDDIQTKIGEKTLELTKAKNDLEMKHNSFIASIDAVTMVLNNDKDNVTRINF